MTARTILLLMGLAAPALAAPPELPGANVTLPYRDLKGLLDEISAARRPPERQPPPVPAVLLSAAYRVRWSGDALRGTVAIAGTVLADGWQRVPILDGDLACESVEPPDAMLVRTERGWAYLAGQPGPFAVRVGFVARAREGGADGRFGLPSVPAPIRSLVVDGLPEHLVAEIPGGARAEGGEGGMPIR
jgi:hypothetical protein